MIGSSIHGASMFSIFDLMNSAAFDVLIEIEKFMDLRTHHSLQVNCEFISIFTFIIYLMIIYL